MNSQKFLRQTRVAAGLTQGAAAKRLGVSRAIFNRWETARCPIPAHRLAAFVKEVSEDIADNTRTREAARKIVDTAIAATAKHCTSPPPCPCNRDTLAILARIELSIEELKEQLTNLGAKEYV